MHLFLSDVRPLSAVEGDGLIQFANAMIKVGTTHGCKSNTSFQIHYKKKHKKSASFSSEKLIEEVNKAIKKYSLVGITTYLSTDLRSRNFYSITIILSAAIFFN